MKRKTLIVAVAGFVLLGGAVAFANDDAEVKSNPVPVEVISKAPEPLAVVSEGDDKIEAKQEITTTHTNEVYDDASNKKERENGTKLSKEAAVEIATNETPGKVKEVEFDDGKYEVEIKTDKAEIDYEIDAQNGSILERDIDNHDHDDDWEDDDDDDDDDHDDWEDDDRSDD